MRITCLLPIIFGTAFVHAQQNIGIGTTSLD